MPTETFYPYRTAGDSIQLNVDVSGMDFPRGSDGSLKLYEDHFEGLSLSVAVAVPTVVYDAVLPASEAETQPCLALLTGRSVDSKRRASWELHGDGMVFQAGIPVRRQDWYGTLELQAVLVRSTTNEANPVGFAYQRGSLLAWSSPIRVHFDEPPMPPGDVIEVVWRRFDEEEDQWLRRHAGNIFALEPAMPKPRVLLNSGFPQAREVLDSQGTRGWIARIRDATFYMIAHQVWTSLLAGIVDKLVATAEDGGPEMDALQDWEKGVFRTWAEYLYPEFPREDCMSALVDAIDQRDARDDLIHRRLPNAVQTKLRTTRGFDGLMREWSGR